MASLGEMVSEKQDLENFPLNQVLNFTGKQIYRTNCGMHSNGRNTFLVIHYEHWGNG